MDYQVLTGYKLKLLCSVEGEPYPNIEWRKNNEVIKTKKEDFLVIDTNELANSAEYTCQASNSFGTTSAKSRVDIIGKFLMR